MMRSKASKDSSHGFQMSCEISFLISIRKILPTSGQKVELTSKNFHFGTKQPLIVCPPAFIFLFLICLLEMVSSSQLWNIGIWTSHECCVQGVHVRSKKKESECWARQASCVMGKQRKHATNDVEYQLLAKLQQCMLKKGSPEFYFLLDVKNGGQNTGMCHIVSSMHRPPYSHSSIIARIKWNRMKTSSIRKPWQQRFPLRGTRWNR